VIAGEGALRVGIQRGRSFNFERVVKDNSGDNSSVTSITPGNAAGSAQTLEEGDPDV
jgi:hypothetical protein